MFEKEIGDNKTNNIGSLFSLFLTMFIDASDSVAIKASIREIIESESNLGGGLKQWYGELLDSPIVERDEFLSRVPYF